MHTYQQQEDYPQTQGPSTKFTSSCQRLLAHFKNCIHDGYFSDSSKREGPGITILDGGSVLLGNYKNDQNVGISCIFLTTDTYFIGEFNKGALDGGFVIRSPSLTLYSAFVNNKIQGELILIDYESWVAQLWTVENNGEGQISKEMSLGEIMNSYLSYEQIKRIENNLSTKLDKTRYIPYEPSILKSLAPYVEKLPTISEFLRFFKAGSQEFQNLGPQIFSHKVYQNNQIVMLNANGDSQFLALALNKKQELIAYGQFKEIQYVEKIEGKERMSSFECNYVLNGIGLAIEESRQSGINASKMMERRVIYSGEFTNHRLNGEGCKWMEGQKVIYGKFADGNIRNADVIKLSSEKDDEIKRLELKRLKNLHIHSLKYHNNYANQRPIYILLNLFEMMAPKDKTNAVDV